MFYFLFLFEDRLKFISGIVLKNNSLLNIFWNQMGHRNQLIIATAIKINEPKP